MAQNRMTTAANGNGKHLPPEAYDYNDDVSAATVAEIRSERGIDVTQEDWETIDALGQIVSA